jgi:hypothetical protein
MDYFLLLGMNERASTGLRRFAIIPSREYPCSAPKGAKMLHLHIAGGQKYSTNSNRSYCFQSCVSAMLQQW